MSFVNGKKEYHCVLFSGFKNNVAMTNWYKSIKSKSDNTLLDRFSHDNVTYIDTFDIANDFDDVFINIPKVLLTEIELPSTFDNVDDYINTFQNHAFSFTRIYENLIIRCINDLKNTNSSGLYKITNKCIKYVKHMLTALIIIFTLLINQILSFGTATNQYYTTDLYLNILLSLLP